MGFNTAFLILNDSADGLLSDQNIGRKMYDAMNETNRPENRVRGVSFGVGNCANGGHVLAPQHADDVQIIAVGGNCMMTIGTAWRSWADMRDPVKLVKELAAQHGYRLVKKVVRS